MHQTINRIVMRFIITILISIITSVVAFAQRDMIRVEALPSVSFTLRSGFTEDTHPTSTTEYSSLNTYSFFVSYLKSTSKEHQIKAGLGFLLTGYKASYSQDPPLYFSGRTDILKASYIHIPVSYIFPVSRLKMEVGLSGNIMMNEKRILGSGQRGYHQYEVPFDTFELGLETAIYYSFDLTGKTCLNLGLKPQYIITENQLNCGVLVGFDFKLNESGDVSE